MLVKALTMTARGASDLAAEFSRIQFTPDPDAGRHRQDCWQVLARRWSMHDEPTARRRFVDFRAGPIFANLVLADEINRATPKTQSALLEAMQEHAVTVRRATTLLPAPFLVAATQNPLEMEGTYPLPEAQLDRFLLKLEVALPSHQDLREIGLKTTSNVETPTYKIIDRNSVLNLQELVREIVVAPHVADFAARLVLATHPGDANAPEQVTRFVRYGRAPARCRPSSSRAERTR
jgi:MoxR-like ATPase